jgi:hypothetical protein
VVGHVYTAEFTDAVRPEGSWQPLGESRPGTGAILELRVTLEGLLSRFYRLQVRAAKP